MARYLRFTFLCDAEERQAIANLAKYLRRSQSDTVRFVVLEAAKKLPKVNINSSKTKQTGTQEIKAKGNNELTG